MGAAVVTGRFDKDLEEAPTDGEAIDYLGTLMSMDSERTYLEMCVHITNVLEILNGRISSLHLNPYRHTAYLRFGP